MVRVALLVTDAAIVARWAAMRDTVADDEPLTDIGLPMLRTNVATLETDALTVRINAAG